MHGTIINYEIFFYRFYPYSINICNTYSASVRNLTHAVLKRTVFIFPQLYLYLYYYSYCSAKLFKNRTDNRSVILLTVT